MENSQKNENLNSSPERSELHDDAEGGDASVATDNGSSLHDPETPANPGAFGADETAVNPSPSNVLQENADVTEQLTKSISILNINDSAVNAPQEGGPSTSASVDKAEVFKFTPIKSLKALKDLDQDATARENLLSDLQKRMKKRGLQGRNTNAADLKDVLDAIFLRKIKKNGTLSRRSFFDKKMKLDLTGKSKARGKSIALNDHSYVKNMIMEALKVPRDDRKQLRELFDAYYRSHDYIIDDSETDAEDSEDSEEDVQ